jgi:hypothetical protein
MDGLLLDRHGFAALAAANDNARPWPVLGALLAGACGSLLGWAGLLIVLLVLAA